MNVSVSSSTLVILSLGPPKRRGGEVEESELVEDIEEERDGDNTKEDGLLL